MRDPGIFQLTAVALLSALYANAAVTDQTITIESGSAVGRRADGHIVWKRSLGGEPVTSVRSLGDGFVELNSRIIVNSLGKVVRSVRQPPDIAAPKATPSTTALAWTDPVAISVGNGYTVGPVFDAAGNAYVCVWDSLSLRIAYSNGTSGVWQPPVTILADGSPPDVCAIAADPAGNVTVAYRTDPAPSQYSLQAVHFNAASGLSGPETVYQGVDPFQTVELTTDSFNNVVAILDLGDQATSEYDSPDGIASIVYCFSTGSWEPLQRIATPTGTITYGSPSTAVSPSRAYLAVVFVQDEALGPVYVSHYSPATRLWGGPESLPLSGALFRAPDGLSYFPFTIDNVGNATLVFPYAVGRKFATYGYRYESGRWQIPATLLPLGDIEYSYTNSYTDDKAIVNSAGVFLTGVVLSTPQMQQVTMYRYTPGSGWKTEIVEQFTGGANTDVQVAWYGLAGEAVVNYSDGQPKSMVYDGTSWSIPVAVPDLAVIPDEEFSGMNTTPSGDVAWISDGYALWLHP